MFLPINGRVAIIDDSINEAKPLLQIFSKYRIPNIYFDPTDSDFIPDDENSNDIRLLFLDLNFLDKTTQDKKNVKSSLYAILKRVISENNFPYLIILWSTQESTYYDIVIDLFNNELKDRAPISIEKFIKTDYIDLDGEILKNGDEKLINSIKEIYKSHQAYSTLVYWENKLHKAADNVLQNIFSAYDGTNWVNKTNFIIEKLSQGYLGFGNHKDSGYIKRTKGALQAFNSIFYDTLESQINLDANIEEQNLLNFDELQLEKDTILDTLNLKLIASDTELELDYTGTVNVDTSTISDSVFNNVLIDSIDRFSFIAEIEDFSTLDKKNQSKSIEKLYSKMRKDNRQTWKKTYVVVTPLCDKVQNKHRKIRIVKGFIIEKKYKKYIDAKSEAIYISPSFYLEDEKKSFILVLNFRYLFTFPTDKKILDSLKNISPFFRLRSSVISEIQSKLSRHVSRQGILYVE